MKKQNPSQIPYQFLQPTIQFKQVAKSNGDLLVIIEQLEADLMRCNLDKALAVCSLESDCEPDDMH